MTQHFASPPEAAAIAAAKRQMIDAFYNASPARLVERHPLLIVTATTSAALAVTVIAHAPLARRLATASMAQAVKSIMPFMRSYAAMKMKASPPNPPAPEDVAKAAAV